MRMDIVKKILAFSVIVLLVFTLCACVATKDEAEIYRPMSEEEIKKNLVGYGLYQGRGFFLWYDGNLAMSSEMTKTSERLTFDFEEDDCVYTVGVNLISDIQRAEYMLSKEQLTKQLTNAFGDTVKLTSYKKDGDVTKYDFTYVKDGSMVYAWQQAKVDDEIEASIVGGAFLTSELTGDVRSLADDLFTGVTPELLQEG